MWTIWPKRVLLAVMLWSCVVVEVMAQSPPAELPKPLQLSAQDDHKKMMEALGIKELRRGADGNNPNAPNAANKDESKATVYTSLPDPLVFANGQPVKSAEDWKKRRAELLELFDREIYGRVPKNVPKVVWEVKERIREKVGEYDVTTKKVVGKVDNSSYPHITVEIQLSLTTPTHANGPVPVMMEHGFVFPRRPGTAPPVPPRTTAKPWTEQLIEKGWGYAIYSPYSVQADTGGGKGFGGNGPHQGLTTGIIGLCNQGQPRKPDDWGALRAWAWGASRALDYLETDHDVDAKQVGIEGLSRFGKAAIVTMAYDERFAIGLIGSSGQGGVKIMRRNYGEKVENLAGSGSYHWMAGNFLKYAGPLTPNDLPVDAHELVSLCAPRPVFISVGSEKVEGTWIDSRGTFLATFAAGPVYKLLGRKDLGTTEFPKETTALIDGDLAFRQHEGGHTVGPNWPTFLRWADRYIKAPTLKPSGPAPKDNLKPAVNWSIPRMDANSRTAHQQLVDKARKGRIDLYFLGDSITRRWGATDYPEFLKNWNENFHGWNAANFGWGGDTIQNIHWRILNGELDGVNPKVIVLMAGTNNLGSLNAASGTEQKVAEVVEGLQAILKTCRTIAPDATVILMGITPRGDNAIAAAAVDIANERIARLADGKQIKWLNINSKLTDERGQLLDGVTVDRLHLSLKGYQIWADELKPLLKERLGPPAKIDLAPPPTGDPSAASRNSPMKQKQ